MGRAVTTEDQYLIMCGCLGCGTPASKAVILGSGSYIVMPAANGLKVAAPLTRHNICDRHLIEFSSINTEVFV